MEGNTLTRAAPPTRQAPREVGDGGSILSPVAEVDSRPATTTTTTAQLGHSTEKPRKGHEVAEPSPRHGFEESEETDEDDDLVNSCTASILSDIRAAVQENLEKAETRKEYFLHRTTRVQIRLQKLAELREQRLEITHDW